MGAVVRVELEAQTEDAALLREAAEALRDPLRRAEALVLLERLPHGRLGFKAFLVSAPLDGVHLERSAVAGREIDF